MDCALSLDRFRRTNWRQILPALVGPWIVELNVRVCWHRPLHLRQQPPLNVHLTIDTGWRHHRGEGPRILANRETHNQKIKQKALTESKHAHAWQRMQSQTTNCHLIEQKQLTTFKCVPNGTGLRVFCVFCDGKENTCARRLVISQKLHFCQIELEKVEFSAKIAFVNFHDRWAGKTRFTNETKLYLMKISFTWAKTKLRLETLKSYRLMRHVVSNVWTGLFVCAYI